MRLAAVVCVLLAVLPSPPAQAKKGGRPGGSCQLTRRAQTFDFGSYSPFDGGDLLFEADILDYRCSANDLPVEIEIDYGAAGAPPRRMTNGAHSLEYRLFQDAGRGTPWDGPLPAPGVSGRLRLYGTIPARQDVSAGAYTDTIWVTFYP